MSAHRSPRGGEVAELARLLPVPVERDLPDERMLLLREHLMGELHEVTAEPLHKVRIPGAAG